MKQFLETKLQLLIRRPSRAFRAVFAGGVLFAATQCGGARPDAATPAPQTSSVVVEPDGGQPVCADPNALLFTFENPGRPVFFGEATAGAYNNGSSDVQDKFYATLGRHYSLLRIGNNAAAYDEYLAPLTPFLKASFSDKARATDEFVDKTTGYASDKVLYGTASDDEDKFDHWAPPFETMAKIHNVANSSTGPTAGWGDCDKSAFDKYFILVDKLKVPAENVYMIFIQTHDLTGKAVGHMIVAVNVNEDPRQPAHFVYLNNNEGAEGSLEEENSLKDYKPIFAFNEKGVLIMPATRPEEYAMTPRQPPVCVPMPSIQISRSSKTL